MSKLYLLVLLFLLRLTICDESGPSGPDGVDDPDTPDTPDAPETPDDPAGDGLDDLDNDGIDELQIDCVHADTNFRYKVVENDDGPLIIFGDKNDELSTVFCLRFKSIYETNEFDINDNLDDCDGDDIDDSKIELSDLNFTYTNSSDCSSFEISATTDDGVEISFSFAVEGENATYPGLKYTFNLVNYVFNASGEAEDDSKLIVVLKPEECDAEYDIDNSRDDLDNDGIDDYLEDPEDIDIDGDTPDGTDEPDGTDPDTPDTPDGPDDPNDPTDDPTDDPIPDPRRRRRRRRNRRRRLIGDGDDDDDDDDSFNEVGVSSDDPDEFDLNTLTFLNTPSATVTCGGKTTMVGVSMCYDDENVLLAFDIDGFVDGQSCSVNQDPYALLDTSKYQKLQHSKAYIKSISKLSFALLVGFCLFF